MPTTVLGRSSVAVFVVWSALLILALQLRSRQAFKWDAFGYHLYLTAAFVHDDPFLKDGSWVDAERERVKASGTLYQVTRLENGVQVIKYPLGLSLLWAPWHLVGHGLALLTGHPTDGYSPPYQLAILTGVFVYLLCALLVLFRVLRMYFQVPLAIALLVLVFFGTNLLDQAISGWAMPHVMLFCGYCLLLDRTIVWKKHDRQIDAVRIAIIVGLMALIRPTEILAILIPLLWVNTSGMAAVRKDLQERRQHWNRVFLILAMMGCIQFAYWWIATGQPLVDTYANAGEGLDLASPHTLPFLFSFRKGWLIYTPLMAFALVGLLALRRRIPGSFLAISLFLIAYVYITSSWTCWWYADSFGSRPMVAVYPVLLLPLGSLLQLLWERRTIVRIGLVLLMMALVAFNIFQLWQYTVGLIHPSRMTAVSYSAVFGETRAPEGLSHLLLVDRSDSTATEAPDLARYSSKRLPLPNGPDGPGDEPEWSLSKDDPYSPAVRIPYRDITKADHVRVETEWQIQAEHGTPLLSSVAVMVHGGKEYGYSAQDLIVDEGGSGTWHVRSTFYLTPEIRDLDDELSVYCWLRDTTRVTVRGPFITVHEPRWP
ncbi:MAG: hypothetical protein KDB88_13060 [Flavobacteriales bacterium]|nr:hypothetical protein [Flavobacteriales bacterium]